MRSVLLIAHTSRAQIMTLAMQASARLRAAGFEVRMLEKEATACGDGSVTVVDEACAAEGTELVLVLGGDGTFLRAAELARPAGVPMLGVNLGHVGFLAEAEPDGLASAIDSIVENSYTVEERMTVDAEISVDGVVRGEAWALNEVSLERTNRERMLEIAVAVDDRPLLRFGCDGVLCATPTGSTAYAFSAGGPIVWPNVEALLVVPNARTRCSPARSSSRPVAQSTSTWSAPGTKPSSAATDGARWRFRPEPGSGFGAGPSQFASPASPSGASPTGSSPSSSCRYAACARPRAPSADDLIAE